MKKFLAIIMALILTFSLAACKSNKNDLSSSSEPSAIIQNDDFKTPDNYAVILLASINPQIKLYLDKEGIVLAIEAVNDDAKSVVSDIIFKNTNYETVIKLFISASNSKGFIKDNAKIDFEIIETKNNEININDILNKASQAATNAANELKIILSSNIIGEIDTNNETPNNSNQTNANENNTNTSKPTQTQSGGDTHTHNFSAATCTVAAKCVCGATNGSALGHKWENATCKAPKTCKVCSATEGNKGEHSFSNGKCSVCGIANTLNPKKDLDTSKEYVGNLKVSGDMLIGGALQFDSEACVVVTRYFNSVQTDPDQTPIVFEGKNYYSEGGGMNPHYFEITDTEIIVKGSFWEGNPDTITIKLVLQSNGTLKVTYSTNSLFPVGCVFSSNINDVLK